MQTSTNPPSIGVLMLESKFPRIVGDIGNSKTWPFPVIYKTVVGASPTKVVRENADDLLGAFIQAGKELIDEGVDGITTSCGFLSVFQKELSQALSVPVLTSSLMQIAMINQILPEGKMAGILTISASSLTKKHLQSANVPAGTPIETTEGGHEFTRVILNNETTLNIELARQDNVEAALSLKSANRHLGAIVLECTNMSPYANDIARATNLPVFSIETFISWFHSGLKPKQFG